jgi:hypothetical protein
MFLDYLALEVINGIKEQTSYLKLNERGLSSFVTSDPCICDNSYFDFPFTTPLRSFMTLLHLYLIRLI